MSDLSIRIAEQAFLDSDVREAIALRGLTELGCRCFSPVETETIDTGRPGHKRYVVRLLSPLGPCPLHGLNPPDNPCIALSRALLHDHPTHAVVPREPTRAMLDIGYSMTPGRFDDSWTTAELYRAMIDASEQACD